MSLKQVEKYLLKLEYKYATEIMRKLVDFLESNQEKFDIREAYLENEKTKGIVNLIWSLMLLPINYLDSEFLYNTKRLFYFLYSNEVPPFLKDE